MSFSRDVILFDNSMGTHFSDTSYILFDNSRYTRFSDKLLADDQSACERNKDTRFFLSI